MGCPTSGRGTKSLSINTGPVSLLIRDGGNEDLPSLGHAPHALACDPHCSHVWHTIGTHGTHHRCVFGVIMDTPPRICTPSTIGPAARSFHPLLPPLLEAPTAPHPPTFKLPTRSGRRHAHTTYAPYGLTCTHAQHTCTSAATHEHKHTHRHTRTHTYTHKHKHTLTHTYTHTQTHTYTPIKNDFASISMPCSYQKPPASCLYCVRNFDESHLPQKTSACFAILAPPGLAQIEKCNPIFKPPGTVSPP